MLKLYYEQLSEQLNKGLELYPVYFLFGNDPLLLQESYDVIRRAAVTKGFNEHYTFQLDNNTNWQEIFLLCQSISIFAIRRTIQLLLPENGPDITINKQLATLVDFLHNDILLILRGNKLNKYQESATWFTTLSSYSIQVSCITPELKNLPHWVATRAKNISLQIDNEACQLLCHYYEGNLIALVQTLEKLSLLWPDNMLTLTHVEKLVNNAAHFTPSHWIDALLMAKNERALRILQQLRLEGNEPVILIRALQRDLLLLVNLKRKSIRMPLHFIFSKYRIWQNRREMITKALNRFNELQLYYAVRLLARTEIILKQKYDQLVWDRLERLSILLCHKVLAEEFIHN